MSDDWQMCEVSDILPNEPQCGRLARWRIENFPEHGKETLLCNHHAEPFEPGVRSRAEVSL